MEVRQTDRFANWLAGLDDDQAQARIALRLRRLAMGNPGDVTPAGEGISELRIHAGPGYRVYYAQSGRTIIVLLCGGTKRTQAKDIREAKALARIVRSIDV